MNNLKILSGDLMMNIKTKTGKTLRILLALLFSVLIAGVAYAEDRPADPIQQDKLEAGKKVYFKRCVWCHGVEGGFAIRQPVLFGLPPPTALHNTLEPY